MSTELKRVKVDYSNLMLLEHLNMLVNSYTFKDKVIDEKIFDLITYLNEKLYPDLHPDNDYLDIIGYAVYEEFECETLPRIIDSVPSLLNAINNGRKSSIDSNVS